MDRFIDLAQSTVSRHLQNLKSNMDRFIEHRVAQTDFL